jgi:hypothetical protein
VSLNQNICSMIVSLFDRRENSTGAEAHVS